MPITYKHTEPKALEKEDDVSSFREAYIDKKELVTLTVEMDVAKAWEFFNKLPEHILSPLPPGYQWVKANENYSIIKDAGSKDHDISLVLYGPDKTNYINFLCLVDGVTTYSFAQTKNGKGPDRAFPMTSSNYRVPDYDYSEKRYNGHVRGHLIDHQDTILTTATKSTKDARNYVPEPPEYEWGLGFRRLKVAELRKASQGGAYAQMNFHLKEPLKTANGAQVPEDVRFFTYTKDGDDGKRYIPDEVYHVEFEEDMSRPKGVAVLEHANDTFLSSFEAAPVVVPYSPDLSDRGLRLQGRNSENKAQNIADEEVVSRFREKDERLARCVAADEEFESAGRQLTAGICTNEEDEELSLAYIKRTLFFGDSLNQLDEGSSIFQEEEARRGKSFFKKQDSADMEELADHFKKLCSDQGEEKRSQSSYRKKR